MVVFNPAFPVFSFLFGLIWGSFLNVCIHRIPLKQSIVHPSSSCPNCGTPVRFYDNIPIISYVFLLGRCRHCGKRISVQYPVVELIMGLLSLGLFLKFGLSPQYFLFFLFSAALVIISFIDLHHQIIPDIISLPGIIIGLAVSFVFIHIGWMDSMIGIIAGGGSLYIVAFVFERLTGKEGMGGGDVKLLAMIGAWMGWRGLLFIILLSSLTGTVIGSISLLAARKGLKAKIPFGPFLSLGALIYLFWGQELKFWYYNLFLL